MAKLFVYEWETVFQNKSWPFLSVSRSCHVSTSELRHSLSEALSRYPYFYLRDMDTSIIPSPVTLLHFSVPISAQKLCEHFQKCAISPVEDRPESS
jgi:hypothetical protein